MTIDLKFIHRFHLTRQNISPAGPPPLHQGRQGWRRSRSEQKSKLVIILLQKPGVRPGCGQDKIILFFKPRKSR